MATVESSANYGLISDRGDGHRLLTIFDDERRLSLEPSGYPLILGLLISLVVVVPLWFVLIQSAPTLWPPGNDVPVFWFFDIAVSLACGGYVLQQLWRLLRSVMELNRGPWLVYDKQRRVLSLPRSGVRVSLDEVIRFQQVSAYLKPTQTDDLHESELQVLIHRGESADRYLILSSYRSFGAFNSELKALGRALDVPIQLAVERAEGRWTVKPWEPQVIRFTVFQLIGLMTVIAVVLATSLRGGMVAGFLSLFSVFTMFAASLAVQAARTETQRKRELSAFACITTILSIAFAIGAILLMRS
jgi:hypothetical protein